MPITFTYIDTACVLLDIDGYRIMTDPTLDKAGQFYHHGFGAFSKKTASPSIAMEHLPVADCILLSHHQHKDNFDHQGRKYAEQVNTIFSTVAASKKMPGVKGLKPWDAIHLQTPGGTQITITAVPAQHHPHWLPEFFSGPVIGFVLECRGATEKTIYISGDTVFFRGMAQIAERFPHIDVAILHVGAARFRYLTGNGRYTMHGKDMVKAIALLKPKVVIPVHHSGWSHFSEQTNALQHVIAQAAINAELCIPSAKERVISL